MTKHEQPKVDTSPKVSDEVRQTTCYMCACRCGINVHMKGGEVAYIEGNRDHPVNRGVLCAKGSAGIMQHLSPARLKAPLKRVGPRGSGEFEEISWDEALQLARSWLEPLRETAPEKLAFFTGRDQASRSQAGGHRRSAPRTMQPTVVSVRSTWRRPASTRWAARFGNLASRIGTTPSCSCFSAWPKITTATRSRSALARLKARGAKVIGVNPIRSGYNAIADEWVGITPGTDGLFILSLVHCLMKAGKIDLDYLARFTNAACLVNDDASSDSYGLILRDEDGKEMVMDRETHHRVPFDQKGVKPDLTGRWRHAGITIARDAPDGRPLYVQRLRAGSRRPGDRHGCQPDPPHRRRTGRVAFDRSHRACTALDGFPRREARQDDRPPGGLPRHAWNLGPLQRFPDLPRAARVADHSRLG